MLDRGDAAVLVAPVADFYHELDRMQLAPPPFPTVLSANNYKNDAEETLQAEINDLRAALHQMGKSSNDTERIVMSHLAERAKLQKFIAPPPAEPTVTSEPPAEPLDASDQSAAPTPKPAFPSVSIVNGLPGEFADYFEGAIAWNKPNESSASAARQAWERLLNRPAAERHYKSTWAAFMLGRSWETEDLQKARAYYQQVRALATQGFSDSTSLAAASLGWEARLALRANELPTAIELYLQQYAANGWGAGESLEVALGRAVEAGPKTLAPLALDPQLRRLVTAYLISQRWYDDQAQASRFHDATKAWLEAVEQANVKDVESAERFALAAYQANEMELAVRWVNRAPSSPTARWLGAKLLLRAGKVTEATRLLSEIVNDFPVESSTNVTAETPFTDALSVPDEPENAAVPAGRYLRGELGALRLSRREYVQSLDLLLRQDFWADAAYVADRVLTTDELKSYVDENWPAIAPSEDDNKSSAEKQLEISTSNTRYLLARRLTRESRGTEARSYYPAERLAAFDEFMQALTSGWEESLAADQRAKALAAAAYIARTNGMELIGTEADPDWHITDGSYRGYGAGVTADSRTNQEATIVFASTDELTRNEQSKPNPDKPYHYRYQAAALAWEAAKLMPDNSDQTARLLCDAGSWLKAQDPLSADLFYKSLVRRCRRTEIAAVADEIRWFPDFDNDGNVIHPRLDRLDLPTTQEISSPEAISMYPIPGKYFLVQTGDHIRNIVTAVRRLGITLTAKEIFAANPEITPDDYIAGRTILIPLPGAAAAQPDQTASNENISPPEQSQPVAANVTDEPAMPPGAQIYVVESGDTLARIAKKYGIPLRKIMESNGSPTPQLKVGQRLLIPASAGVTE